MPSFKRTFTLRLTDKDYEKIQKISAKNNRSMANQIEYLVKNYIEKYEEEHGVIKTDYDEFDE